MQLTVNARRIKHGKRKVEVIKLLETQCRIRSQDSNVLFLDVEMLGCQGSYRQTFRLKGTTEIKLVGKFSDANYPYRIKWRMGRIHYKLKVNKLSLTSCLIKLNHLFKICHRVH